MSRSGQNETGAGRARATVRYVAAVLAVVAVSAGWIAASHGRAYLGVRVSEDTEQSAGGAVIASVVEGSAAAEAGLEVGDVIVEIDGVPVGGPAELRRRIDAHDPGDAVDVVFVRAGARETARVELGEAGWIGRLRIPGHEEDLYTVPDLDPEWFEGLRERLEDGLSGIHVAPLHSYRKPLLGVHLVDVTPELRRYFGTDRDAGVLVGKVIEDSPAERAGLVVGDLILSLAGDTIRTSGDLIRSVGEHAGETVRIEVLRDGRAFEVDAQLEERERPEPIGPRARLAPPEPPRPSAAPTPRLPAFAPVLLPPAPPEAPRPAHDRRFTEL